MRPPVDNPTALAHHPHPAACSGAPGVVAMLLSPNPKRIMETGLGFWQSRALLVAVQHGVFTHLAAGPMTAEQIRAATGWHPRGVLDLLDGLVAMEFLERDGNGPEARYRNTKETA